MRGTIAKIIHRCPDNKEPKDDRRIKRLWVKTPRHMRPALRIKLSEQTIA